MSSTLPESHCRFQLIAYGVGRSEMIDTESTLNRSVNVRRASVHYRERDDVLLQLVAHGIGIDGSLVRTSELLENRRKSGITSLRDVWARTNSRCLSFPAGRRSM